MHIDMLIITYIGFQLKRARITPPIKYCDIKLLCEGEHGANLCSDKRTQVVGKAIALFGQFRWGPRGIVSDSIVLH